MEPKASSEFLHGLASRLGYRYAIINPSPNIAGGFFLLLLENGLNFNLVECGDRLLALEFHDLKGNLTKWLLCLVHATPYDNEKVNSSIHVSIYDQMYK